MSEEFCGTDGTSAIGCPFCGLISRHETIAADGKPVLECSWCGARGPRSAGGARNRAAKTLPEAVDLWNMRAPQPYRRAGSRSREQIELEKSQVLPAAPAWSDDE